MNWKSFPVDDEILSLLLLCLWTVFAWASAWWKLFVIVKVSHDVNCTWLTTLSGSQTLYMGRMNQKNFQQRPFCVYSHRLYPFDTIFCLSSGIWVSLFDIALLRVEHSIHSNRWEASDIQYAALPSDWPGKVITNQIDHKIRANDFILAPLHPKKVIYLLCHVFFILAPFHRFSPGDNQNTQWKYLYIYVDCTTGAIKRQIAIAFPANPLKLLRRCATASREICSRFAITSAWPVHGALHETDSCSLKVSIFDLSKTPSCYWLLQLKNLTKWT